MHNFLINLKNSPKKIKLFLIITLIIVIGIIVLCFFIANNRSSDSGSIEDTTREEIDPLSGQTIEISGQEPEKGDSNEDDIDMIGFDGFYDHNYSVTQYEILTDNLSTFFKNNYKDISRISIIKDSIKCPDDETYCNSDVVINTGEKFKLYTDTELLNSKTILYIQLKDSKEKIVLEKEEDRSNESTGEDSPSDEE